MSIKQQRRKTWNIFNLGKIFECMPRINSKYLNFRLITYSVPTRLIICFVLLIRCGPSLSRFRRFSHANFRVHPLLVSVLFFQHGLRRLIGLGTGSAKGSWRTKWACPMSVSVKVGPYKVGQSVWRHRAPIPRPMVPTALIISPGFSTFNQIAAIE